MEEFKKSLHEEASERHLEGGLYSFTRNSLRKRFYKHWGLKVQGEPI